MKKPLSIAMPVPADAPEENFGDASASYGYVNEQQELLFYVLRFDKPSGKEFRPLTCWQDETGGYFEWHFKAPPSPRPLYGLDQLALKANAPVLLVEGEKACDAATKLFPAYACITTMNGAQAPAKSNFSPLAGRRLVIWPDADDAGHKYARECAKLAYAAGTIECAIVRLPKGLPIAWDLADPLPLDATIDDLRQFLDNPEPIAASSCDKRQTGYEADQLQHMEFPPIKYIVDGYVPEGATLFAGRPKIGKSWAWLDVSIAVAIGGIAFGSIPCVQGDVLYLALEDNARRLKSRMTKLLGKNQPWPKALRFETEWPNLSDGGVQSIKEWIESKDNPRLVIVDTWGRVRGAQNKQDNAYLADYTAMAEFQALASEKGMAIVIIHHDRKMEADDPIDAVSGTLGLSGAADTILVLTRKPEGVTLYGRGRDIEEIETVIKFDKNTCRWGIVGRSDDVKKSDERTEITNILNGDMKPMKPQEIADILEKPHTAIRQMMVRMARCGDIQKISYGLYASIDYVKDNEGA